MKSRFTVTPFLFGLFPTLFLFAHNVNEVPPGEIVWPLIIVVVITTILHLFLSNLVKDRFKAGLAVVAWWVLFFSFEHAVNLLSIDGSSLAIMLLGVIWLVLFILGLFAILRTRSSLNRLNLVLLVFGLYMVLWQTGVAAWDIYDRSESTIERPTQVSVSPASADLPDIYHIILDGYGRADILADIYKYDNSEFLSFLDEKGFYVADSSYSNYSQTLLSLLSTYLMYYLSDLPRKYGWNFDDRYGLGEVLEHAEVIKLLRSNGYKTAAFSTGYAETEFKSFDYYYNYEGAFSEFHTLVIGVTPLWRIISPFITPYDLQRGQIEFTLDMLPLAAQGESPKFVFVHLTLPHPPFVYDSSGGPVDPGIRFSLADGDHLTRLGMTHDEYLNGYKNNLRYANRRIAKILSQILDRPGRKPIIIVQGDHGPGSELHHESLQATNVKERFAILNAYYFPDGDYSALYEKITPINSFRVILSKIMGLSYEILEDRNYFSGWLAPLDFVEVTYELKPDVLDSSVSK